jgi:hypothetical protein
MEGAPPDANQIDLFMHFLGASRDGLVARRVDLDTISPKFHILRFPNSTELFTKPTGRHYTKYRFSLDIGPNAM